jgi:ribonuclease HI
MLYGASTWITPIDRDGNGGGHKKARGSVGSAAKLGRVQRMATIHITGGLRSSPSDLLDAHADILPIELLIDKYCHREALRLAALPPSHPLAPHVKKAARRKPRRHPSPLHDILHAYNIDPPSIEKIAATRLSPQWHSPLHIRIAPSVSKAVEEEDQDRSDIRIYTDGSGLEGNVGAGAVLYRDGSRKSSLRYRLGSLTRHTVYEGELGGLILGAELLRKLRRVYEVTFYVDNQASILALKSFRRGPGHYMIDIFLKLITRILKSNPYAFIAVRWIPGHEGVQGNEAVDLVAKRAATEGSSHDNTLPACFRSRITLPISKSAIKQQFNANLEARNSGLFAKSPRSNSIHRIDKSLPSNAFMKLTEGLPRRHASLLFQLRSGHIPLYKHLHRIGATDSPLCPTCQGGTESILHFLVDCPAYEPFRRILYTAFKRHARSLHVLLNDPDALRPLFRFINRTGRLQDTFGDLNLPDD